MVYIYICNCTKLIYIHYLFFFFATACRILFFVCFFVFVLAVPQGMWDLSFLSSDATLAVEVEGGGVLTTGPPGKPSLLVVLTRSSLLTWVVSTFSGLFAICRSSLPSVYSDLFSFAHFSTYFPYC